MAWEMGARGDASEPDGVAETGSKSPVPATPDETRREITRLSARGYVAIRQVFVQQDKTAAKLAEFVTGRKHRALLLYLMILTTAPWLGKLERPLGAAVWRRALDAPGTRGPTWSASSLSRAFADLEGLGLLEPGARKGRRRAVEPRREDGRGTWTPAHGTGPDELYFTLPDEFWLDNTFAKLRLPGLAMLLIIAKETNKRPEMYLPFQRAPMWYGLSEKTARNGIRELTELKLLEKRSEYLKMGLSDIGWVERIWYSLTGEYGQLAREKRRETARTEREQRLSGIGLPELPEVEASEIFSPDATSSLDLAKFRKEVNKVD